MFFSKVPLSAFKIESSTERGGRELIVFEVIRKFGFVQFDERVKSRGKNKLVSLNKDREVC